MCASVRLCVCVCKSQDMLESKQPQETHFQRRFPNGTVLYYTKQNGVEKVLWRRGADGSIDLNVEDDPRTTRGDDKCWVRVRQATSKYVPGF